MIFPPRLWGKQGGYCGPLGAWVREEINLGYSQITPSHPETAATRRGFFNLFMYYSHWVIILIFHLENVQSFFRSYKTNYNFTVSFRHNQLITDFSDLSKFNTDSDQGEAIRHEINKIFCFYLLAQHLFCTKYRSSYWCLTSYHTQGWLSLGMHHKIPLCMPVHKRRSSLHLQELSMPLFHPTCLMIILFLYTSGHQNEDSLKGVLLR